MADGKDALSEDMKGQIVDKRAAIARFIPKLFPLDKNVEVEEVNFPESDDLMGLFLNTASIDSPVLLAFHGGFYYLGQAMNFAGLYAKYAAAAGYNAFVVNYSLVPDHKFPQNVKDCVAAYEYLLEQKKVPAHKVVMWGDSAGGGLVPLVLNAIQGNGGKEHPENPENAYYNHSKELPQPRAGVMSGSWFDLTMSSKSYESKKEVDGSAPAFGRTAKLVPFYVDDKHTPKSASPHFMNVEGFSPCRITVGYDEVLIDESRSMARKLEHNDISVQLGIYENMPHCGFNEDNDDFTGIICDKHFNDQVSYLKLLAETKVIPQSKTYFVSHTK